MHHIYAFSCLFVFCSLLLFSAKHFGQSSMFLICVYKIKKKHVQYAQKIHLTLTLTLTLKAPTI